MDSTIEFQVLGPVRAHVDGQPLELGDSKQRLVLAVLLLEPNRLVPLERLVDLLWPQSPPTSSRRIVQAHLSRLRTTLSHARHNGTSRPVEAAVVRHGPGYMLTCDPERIDEHRFWVLLDRARRCADAQEKVRLLREALGLWRGPALADVATENVHDELCRGLDEARLSAFEERFVAELQLGHDGRLIAELIDMAARHPFRQRFTELLMFALYRDGQAVEALAVYARTRQRLDSELGLEPSIELRHLHLAILRGDPLLHHRLTVPLRSEPAAE
ncbi:AfsR/SARP family transcriptional regulator [Longispora sp. K20-0274]|uniref:AfsR/SARP family transcriptional regulator n=1 Tax=Longispora sp. K20-0274 TaxID=3088255 RepID=UPI00399C29C5